MSAPLPTNKAIKDLFEGLLGRDVTLEHGHRVDPLAVPGPSTASYVDDHQQLSALVLLDFPLTAYVGAALGLVPPGGAAAAIEDRQISDSLHENAFELLNVLAASLNEVSATHQRLYQVHRPGDNVPADVAEWQSAVTRRVDVQITVKGYGTGSMSVITLLDG